MEPLLVVLGALWLGWCRSHALAHALARGRTAPVLGALGFAGAVMLFAWATLTRADFLLVPSLALAACGWAALQAGGAALRALALPLGFLVFALPIPAPLLNELVWAQQEAVGRVTVALLSALGLPATAGGILFERPGRLFIVIETCSGLRMAEVFAALAVLLRGSARPSAWRTMLAGAGGAALGLVLNQLRVLWIALGEGALAVGEAHALQGVAVLCVGLPLLTLFVRALHSPSPASEGALSLGVARPWQTLAGLLLLCVGVSLRLAPDSLPRAQPYDLATIPGARAGWESELLPTDFQLLGSVRFDEVMRRGYAAPEGEGVELFVGTALRGDPRASPFSRSTDLPSSGWVVLERSAAEVLGRPVETLLLAAQGRSALAYTWRVGDRGLWIETWRAALALDRNPFAEPRRRAVIRISTGLTAPGEPGIAAASERLARFIEVFSDTLPGAARTPG